MEDYGGDYRSIIADILSQYTPGQHRAGDPRQGQGPGHRRTAETLAEMLMANGNASPARQPNSFSDEDLARQRVADQRWTILNALFGEDQRPHAPRKMDEKGNAYRLRWVPNGGLQWQQVNPNHPANRGKPLFGEDDYAQMQSPSIPALPGAPY